MLSSCSLKGIKVIDLSRMLPGPYCSMVLADHGAEVISIEKKEFKNSGLFFDSLYRNKKHMTLNLKTQKGRGILMNLLRDADVLIEGFRPGVMERLDLDYAKVKKRNSGIIYCSISGYGQTGSKQSMPGHDVNYLSYSGVLGLFKDKEGNPRIPAVQIADILGGAQNAVIGILLALYARDRVGEGQYLDISITDGLLGLLHLPLHYREAGHTDDGDSFLSHRFACYNTYETRDNRFIAVGALEKKFWEKLCLYLGRPDFIELQYDEDIKNEIKQFFVKTFKQKKYQEWVTELEPLSVCCSGLRNLQEVMEDNDFSERGVVINSETKENNRSKMLSNAIKLSKSLGEAGGGHTTFGENTHEILSELGYSKEQINNLFLEDVI